MTGRTVLTLLLYVWIGITVAMVLMWLFRRRSDRSVVLGDPTGLGSSTGEEPEYQPPAESGSRADSTERVLLGGTGPEPPPSPYEDAETGIVTEVDGRDGGEDGGGGHEPADGDHDDRHLVSTALGVGLSSTSAPSIGESVIDLLADMELPYDLEPMDLGNDGRRAVYLSRHPNPEDVGTEFADELVKLGYSIEPMGLDRAVARRGHDVLHMRIVPGAGAVVADDGETRPYGQASTTDTALEVWIDPESDIAVRW